VSLIIDELVADRACMQLDAPGGKGQYQVVAMRDRDHQLMAAPVGPVC